MSVGAKTYNGADFLAYLLILCYHRVYRIEDNVKCTPFIAENLYTSLSPTPSPTDNLKATPTIGTDSQGSY